MIKQIFVCIALLSGLTANAQADPDSLSAPLHLRATDGGGRNSLILLGYHTKATLDYDMELEEIPLPPVPFPLVYDVRFLEPPGSTRMPATGSYSDIRPMRAQADTFFVHYQPENNQYPMRFTWKAEELAPYQSARFVLMHPLEPITVDMKAAQSYDAVQTPEQKIMLILHRKHTETPDINTIEKGAKP